MYRENSDSIITFLFLISSPSACCTISAGAKHLLGKMLTKDPALRITAAEVEHHAWVRGEIMVPGETNVSENVLDMMRLWRSEMMVVYK